MSAHMRKRHINPNKDCIRMTHADVIYLFPKKIAEKYRVDEGSVSADIVFAAINKKYTKPGALIRGIRFRDGITQLELAEKLKVTQSDISQMETGARKIGRKLAKRIEKLYGVHYRSFLD